jgi:putative peptide zinc metalloprotease protein
MLPALREELALFPGPPAGNGSPTWSLQDPVRNLFFQIDWLTFEILSRWHLKNPEKILAAIEQETTIEADEEDLRGIVRFLAENELVQRHDAGGSAWFHDQVQKRRTGIGRWLLHHYLFFRLPLWRPDAWLERALPWVMPLLGRAFVVLTLLALIGGLIEVSRQWAKFTSTLLDTFSLQGMVGYFVTLVCIKFVHELGHAFTAKRHGCRVPTMGVAFLVMFPMAYTDVNEVWKLKDKRQRLAVGSAGIVTELAIAAWATLAWALLPDGFLRGAAFLLATTTWVSTLVINASPFLRFDGYFLLMDWLDMPNLHQRAFELGKWRLRRLLFALPETIPEYLPTPRYRLVLLFCYLTWLYRCVVFGGIAVLVYYFFPKPLGPFLAAVEIAWFIVLPAWREVKDWRFSLPAILRSRRTWLTLGIIASILLVGSLPWDQRVRSQGLLGPAELYPVVAPSGARIEQLPVADGQLVAKGEVLLVLEAPELAFEHQVASARATKLRWQAAAAGVDPELRKDQRVIEAAREKVAAELQSVQGQQARYRPTAPFSGRLFLSQPDILRGDWVAKNEQLAVLVNTSRWAIETYLPEAELNRIRLGDYGRFYSETPHVAQLPVRVERIDRDATRTLPEGMLASSGGGEILVRQSGGQPVPETALYRVTLSLSEEYAPEVLQILRGQVVLYGNPKAYLEEFARSAMALFVREAGF